MAYEIYKTVRSSEEFNSQWTGVNDPQIIEMAYHKYFVKCLVFQRDNFICQNESCKHCKNEVEYPFLTLHHIKFQKNNGVHKLKNGITICRDAHNRFHRGKGNLTFYGMTYKIHKSFQVDWKKIKKSNRQLRKGLKEFHGVNISWELLAELMRFLEIDFSKIDFDEYTGE